MSQDVDRRTVLDRYRRHISRGRATLAELSGGMVEVRSSGCWVFDTDGTAYLDCGGYGVFLLGHRHPRVVDAVIEQVTRHPLATRLLLEPAAAAAAEALACVTGPGLDYVYLTGSGAEAVEAALKLARAHGIRHLIAMTGGYHGKTLGALSATATEVFRRPFQPLHPATHVRFGDSGALSAALERRPDSCVLVEPVQGEGGVVLPPTGYLREVADACRRHGALFVLDEIQTGLGRLGTWWGADSDQVVPDILLVGKNLSGGVVPVSAMVATAEVFEPFGRDPFLHTSTYAAAPVAAAAAHAAIAAIADEGLVERAATLGEVLLTGLRERLAPYRSVLTVRGRGLLIGLDLAEAGLAGELMLALLRERVLVNHSLNAPRVLRLTPPAVLTDHEVEILLAAMARAMETVTATCLR